MTENLTITINGLEYIAKTATANIQLTQKDIIINELQYRATCDALNIQEFSNENKGLAERLKKAEAHIQELTNENKSLEYRSRLTEVSSEDLFIKISDLEETIMELEVALEEKDNENNELRSTLEDISYSIERAL
jgi:predicted RNase H-like nuclease (RuvC/YqgF family)